MYAGKRVRLDLDLLNAPIWQVNRNRVKSVTTGPQQSSSPMKDWPHPRILRPLRFSKTSARSLRSLPIIKEGWRRQDQRFNVTIEWRDHHHSQHNLLPPTQHTHTLPPRLCYTGARSTELTGRRLKYVLNQNSASDDSFESGGRVLLEVEYSIRLSLLPSNSSLMKNELRSGLGMYTPNLESARESKYLALKKNKREKIKTVFIKWD